MDKDKVVCCLCNLSSNMALLAAVPHRIVADDIAMIYTDNDGIVRCGDEERLYEAAMANSPTLRPVELESIAEMINSIVPGAAEGYEESPIYVLTNEQKCLGAAALFYPDIMENLGNILGCDYAVLPASIHEVLIVPAMEDLDMEALESTVEEVNKIAVEENEQLSNFAYYYERATATLRSSRK